MRPTSRLAASAALAVTLAATLPASAMCVLCNSTVRLDASLAACFAERQADLEQKLAASGKDFVIVDLSDCTSRGSLPTSNAASGTPPVLDKQFVADAGGLKCLEAKIAEADDAALDPSHVFELGKDCPAQ